MEEASIVGCKVGATAAVIEPCQGDDKINGLCDHAVVRMYASRAVQFHPHGGQFDFVWLSARTPHGAYVW